MIMCTYGVMYLHLTSGDNLYIECSVLMANDNVYIRCNVLTATVWW